MRKIREATLQDAADLGAILSDWIDETSWMPRLHSRAQDIGFLTRLITKTRVKVVLQDQRARGFLAREGAEITALYLDAMERGQGHGAELLEAAKRDSGGYLELWCFQVNKSAQRFYQKHGFVEIGRTDGRSNDEKLPDIQMKWEATT